MPGKHVERDAERERDPKRALERERVATQAGFDSRDLAGGYTCTPFELPLRQAGVFADSPNAAADVDADSHVETMAGASVFGNAEPLALLADPCTCSCCACCCRVHSRVSP